MKQKWSVVILAVLFGWFGIHRMYLGQYFIWFLYLIFCWTLVPLVISILEIIYFIFISKTDFDNTYNLDYMLKMEQLEKLKLNKQINE